MSLPALQLDDLTWRDFIDGIRKRIIANSNAEWTLHSAIDPGITLLELQSWLYEQRLYWADQLSEPLVLSLMALMGEHLQSAQAASSLIKVKAIDNNLKTTIEQASIFTASFSDSAIALTTQHRLHYLPFHQNDNAEDDIRIIVADQDRTIDLNAQRVFELLPANGQFAQVELQFALAQPLQASDSNQIFSFYLELDTFAQINPAWSKQAVTVLPAAQIDWYYLAANGQRNKLQPGQVIDGTLGLRRSGLVQVSIPDDWHISEASVPQPFIYSLWLTCQACDFSYPPRLQRLLANVVTVEQYKTVELSPSYLQSQIESWLKLPNQQIQLLEQELPPLEDSVFLRIFETDQQWHLWQTTDNFYHHGPQDRVFIVDREQKRIHFGNGLTGRIPVLATKNAKETLKVCYLASAGSSSNFASHLTWQNTKQKFIATNIVDLVDGKDCETIEQLQARVSSLLQQRERAISADDFEQLSLTTPGIAIARAKAAVGFHPRFPCTAVPGAVTVFAVAEVPRDGFYDDPFYEDSFTQTEFSIIKSPQLDPGAHAELHARLNQRRLITTEVFVCSPNYRRVHLQVELEGVFANQRTIRLAVAKHLLAYLDPLLGGDDKQGWPFGAALRPSSFIKQVQSLLPEGVVVQNVAVGLDDNSSFESCRDTEIGQYDLVYLASINTTINQQSTDSGSHGGLR